MKNHPQRRFRLRSAGCVIPFLLLLLLGIYSCCIEPYWPTFERQTIQLNRLPAAFRDYRIIQLSDIHFKKSHAGYLRKLTAKINALDADLIVLTGDYATRDTADISNMTAILGNLRARDGVFAVLGNHDHWTNAEVVTSALQSVGITVLNNSTYPLRRNGQRLWLVGIDSVYCAKNNITQAMQQVPTDEAVVLLVHEPDFADTARKLPIDLQLSGHAHGGQIRLPLIGGLIYPPYGKKYPMGRYQLDKLTLYVNRGLGNIFDIRLCCRPEISIFSLQPGASKGKSSSERKESHIDI